LVWHWYFAAIVGLIYVVFIGAVLKVLFRSEAAVEDNYDAFLSYGSKDVKFVRRLQRFLQSFRKPTSDGSKRRVRVYLDYTDIRGGDLSAEIKRGLAQSRTLIVCVSPAAIDSKWVEREIDHFRCECPDRPIAAALIAGELKIVQALLSNVDQRFHDIRGAWRLGLLRPRAKLELLRLLALITDVELRELRNWWLRRAIAQVAAAVAAAIVIPAAILSAPVQHWKALRLVDARGKTVYPIASDLRGGKLRVAARFQGQGSPGFRNYIMIFEDAIANPTREEIIDRFDWPSRLLPLSVATLELDQRARQVLGQTNESTEPETCKRPIWAGEPKPGMTVVLAPIGPAQEEVEEAEKASDDAGYSIEPVGGALIIVSRNDQIRSSRIRLLDPRWAAKLEGRDPASPSSAIAVAAGPGEHLWIGVPARADRVAGGLWHSGDGGATWQQIDGFTSVGSLLMVECPEPAVLVAESHHSVWKASMLSPRPARVVRGDVTGTNWAPASVPPFGTRSDVELVGQSSERKLIIRVDETIFQLGQRPLWRWLVE
jgi:TIR domain